MNKMGLKIVSTAHLVLHETNDPKRSLNVQKSILNKKLFTNPILVAKLPGSKKYVVLDGANRTTALRELNIPFALVQDFDYKKQDLDLQTWWHLLEEKDFSFWLKTFSSFLVFKPGNNISNTNLFSSSAKVYLVNKKKIFVAMLKGTVSARLNVLNNLVDCYRGKFQYSRLKDYKNGDAVDRGTLLVFPHLKKDDIVQVAKNGLFIPSGISRHVVNGRALHVNLPLAVLQQPGDLLSKQKFLDQHVEKKVFNREYRWYDDSVCLFDE